MIDITKNTTPHGLLREIDPEAAAAPKRLTQWANMYSDGLIASGYCTREAADSAAIGGRIAVLRVERDEDGGNVTFDVETV